VALQARGLLCVGLSGVRRAEPAAAYAAPPRSEAPRYPASSLGGPTSLSPSLASEPPSRPRPVTTTSEGDALEGPRLVPAPLSILVLLRPQGCEGRGREAARGCRRVRRAWTGAAAATTTVAGAPSRPSAVLGTSTKYLQQERGGGEAGTFATSGALEVRISVQRRSGRAFVDVHC